MRSGLRAALSSGEVVLEDGELVGTFADPSASATADTIVDLIALAEALDALSSTWLDALLQRALRDPDPAIRAQTVRNLNAHSELRDLFDRYRMRHHGLDDTPDALLRLARDPALEALARASAFLGLLDPLPLSRILELARSATSGPRSVG